MLENNPFGKRKTSAAPGDSPMWQPGHVRAFACHLAAHVAEVEEIAAALAPYGFSTFVAHRDLAVSAPWRQEIARALDESDCMLVFEHRALHDSQWTDQEIGWALGRSVPIVVLAYPGGATLAGFLEQYQAFPVKENDSGDTLAAKIFDVLVALPAMRDRAIDGLIAALGTAGEYVDARTTMERLETMADELRRSDLLAILHHYRTNHEVREARIADAPLRRLVERRAPDLLSEFWSDVLTLP